MIFTVLSLVHSNHKRGGGVLYGREAFWRASAEDQPTSQPTNQPINKYNWQKNNSIVLVLVLGNGRGLYLRYLGGLDIFRPVRRVSGGIKN